MTRLAWGFTLFALVSCSSAAPDGAPRGAQSAPAPVAESVEKATPAAPEIGRLKLRHETLVMRATGYGPRFDVLAADGRVLRRGIDEGDLALTHRELWDVYRSATAKTGPYLDARLDSVSLPARTSP